MAVKGGSAAEVVQQRRLLGWYAAVRANARTREIVRTA